MLLALACAAIGAFLVVRALYALYLQVIKVEASTFVRAPIVLAAHLDKIDRSVSQVDALQLRAVRAVDQIEASLRIWVKTGRHAATAFTAAKALLGSASSLRKMLGS